MSPRGNGAREAVRNLLAEHNLVAVKDYERATDALLGELWMRGFKVVPLDGTEDALEAFGDS